MKLLWLGYLVYSLGNCAIKLCIEIGLNNRERSEEEKIEKRETCLKHYHHDPGRFCCDFQFPRNNGVMRVEAARPIGRRVGAGPTHRAGTSTGLAGSTGQKNQLKFCLFIIR